MKSLPWLSVALSLWTAFSTAETILVVDSYHPEYPWVSSYRQALTESLEPKHELIYFEMDTKRIPRSEFKIKAENAWLAYKQSRPDLVMLADDNALELLAPLLIENTVPFVYFGINANPREYGIGSSTSYFGVLERLLVKRSIVMLQNFLPLERVLLISDSGTTSQAIAANTFNTKKSNIIANLEVDVSLVKSFFEWKENVNTASELGYDAIVVGLYQALVDEHGNSVPENEVIEWTSTHTKIPPFGLWDYSVGPKKMIGGYVISGYEQGRLAAEIALKHFEGKAISSMPVSANSSLLMFSESQLEKWQISIPNSYSQSVRMIE